MRQNLHGDFHTEPLVPLARNLRRSSTDAERVLWQLLRRRPFGAKFRRQHPLGAYVLDFYCVEKQLAIEADGSQHFTPEGLAADQARTDHLAQVGIRMLRFTNREILSESDGVLNAIEQALATQ
jgi:very-short-patch-repair endonuclease